MSENVVRTDVGTLKGDVDIDGTLSVAKAATLSSTLAVTGAVSLATGGAVTQLTNKATAVSLNGRSGKITMNGASLADATTVAFTVNNNTALAGDVVIVNHVSGGTLGGYVVQGNTVADNSFKINVTNISGGALTDALVLRFALITATIA